MWEIAGNHAGTFKRKAKDWRDKTITDVDMKSIEKVVNNAWRDAALGAPSFRVDHAYGYETGYHRGFRSGWLMAMKAFREVSVELSDAMHTAMDGRLRCPDCNGTGREHDMEGAPIGFCDCPDGMAEERKADEKLQEATESVPF